MISLQRLDFKKKITSGRKQNGKEIKFVDCHWHKKMKKGTNIYTSITNIDYRAALD